MTQAQFEQVEAAMLQGMQASVHDTGHVYRVLWNALRIAQAEPAADVEVVILSALLHDIGRAQQAQQPGTGHAELGAATAYRLLLRQGWSEAKAAHVRDCIATHSYKAGLAPESLEAQILFDADKLDLAGAVGTARALLFGAEIDEPFYLTGENGLPTPGSPEEGPSLYREYNRKLKILYQRFFTRVGQQLAKERQKAMDAWFAAFHSEIDGGYAEGRALLGAVLKD